MRYLPLLLPLFAGGSEAFLVNGLHIARNASIQSSSPWPSSHCCRRVNIQPDFRQECLVQSKLLVLIVQENKSNYWMPSLIARHANRSFSSIPLLETRIYYLNNHPEGSKVRAFPQGFRMLAGNPFATAPIPNEDQRVGGRIGYQCQNDHLPYFNYLDFLRASVAFPDYWNGKDLDSPDHKSHVAYRFAGNLTCPPSHPVQMMEIDLEIGYRTEGYNWDQLMLSMGDRAGYGKFPAFCLHADYLSFWDVDLLQRALDDPTCQHRENIVSDGAQCQTLVPHRNDAAMQGCRLEAPIPQEDAGLVAPIPKLPACNLPSNTTKLGPPSDFVNFSWQRFLSGTKQVMLAVYKGFNPAPPKPTTSSTSSTKPTTPIPTTLSTSTLSISTSTSTTAAASPTWTSLGCYTDSTSNCGLPVSATVSGGMTPAKC
ncbi:hypothetical protein B0T16DRAFT_388548 [Cercophora newfieldiana]|uniref:DUF1996 domain-containing protein n=1 Tax=Cercophora newfieldiana TaxID=92897 RepID=A0AA39Y932_9PEZI|nr:hypothetical protein B0T16DRAFT_388548 [Cercophora newfieldiana]